MRNNDRRDDDIDRELARARMENAELRQELDRKMKLLLAGGGALALFLLARSSGGSSGSSSKASEFDTSSREAFMSDCLSATGGDMAECAAKWKNVE